MIYYTIPYYNVVFPSGLRPAYQAELLEAITESLLETAKTIHIYIHVYVSLSLSIYIYIDTS